MQNFELSLGENRIPHFYVFQNRNLKYRKILYAVHNKTPFLPLLKFKLCRRGDMLMYTTGICLENHSLLVIAPRRLARILQL